MRGIFQYPPPCMACITPLPLHLLRLLLHRLAYGFVVHHLVDQPHQIIGVIVLEVTQKHFTTIAAVCDECQPDSLLILHIILQHLVDGPLVVHGAHDLQIQGGVEVLDGRGVDHGRHALGEEVDGQLCLDLDLALVPLHPKRASFQLPLNAEDDVLWDLQSIITTHITSHHISITSHPQEEYMI